MRPANGAIKDNGVIAYAIESITASKIVVRKKPHHHLQRCHSGRCDSTSAERLNRRSPTAVVKVVIVMSTRPNCHKARPMLDVRQHPSEGSVSLVRLHR